MGYLWYNESMRKTNKKLKIKYLNAEEKKKSRASRERKLGFLVLAAIVVGIGFFLALRSMNARGSDDSVIPEIMGTTSCDQFEGPDQYIDGVSYEKKWVLTGDEFSDSEKSLKLEAQLNENLGDFIDEENFIVSYDVIETDVTGDMTLKFDDDLVYEAEIYVGDLEPGSYQVQTHVDFECGSQSSEPIDFNVSYPVYVAWTIDWEGLEIKDQYLSDMAGIADSHDIPMTHFFNPRYYTNPAISKSRADYFRDWVVSRRDNKGDAIGLHMHMFPEMVAAAGVEPKTDPKWGTKAENGYDVLTSAYSYAETVKMMNWAKSVFEQNGLGTPTMYRAGGWFADLETLQAAKDTGFVLDSSGRTYYCFGSNNKCGHWNLKSTTQPYMVNKNNQNAAGSPSMGLWEFPNNGADSYSFSKEQMLQRLDDNYKRGSVSQNRVMVTYLSHPEWFDRDNPKLEYLFGEIDKYRYDKDNGPVVYITLDEAYDIYAK